MYKAELRKQGLQRRRDLTEAAFLNLNLMLLKQFRLLDFSGIRVIHTFLPILEQREPNTMLFIDWLQAQHPQIKIIIPRADFSSLLMTHHEFSGVEGLQKNTYNIMEPKTTDCYTGEIDLILIPLLGFDLKGHRVGYGKGFYDRFLEGQTNAVKTGISLFQPIDRIEDAGPYDVLLNNCITPQNSYHF